VSENVSNGGVPVSRRRLPGLSIEHLWPLAVLAGVFALVSTSPIRPHDFWWHLKVGQEIAASGRIPGVDAFSSTMTGAPYNNYASYWLMEVAYHFIYGWGGPALIIFFHSLLVTAAYMLLLRLCWWVSRSWRIAAVSALFAAVLGFDNWNVRPQAIAFLTGVVVLSAIYGYRSHPRLWLLALPPVALLIWTNGHGSFVIGLLMLGIWLVDEVLDAVQSRFFQRDGWHLARVWPPALTLLVSAAACLVNPRGPGILSYVTGLSGNPVIRVLVPEWAPPSFADRSGALFLAALLACAVVLAISPRRPSRFQILTYVIFGALALSTARSVIWFGIVMAPVLADHLTALSSGRTSPSPARIRTRKHPLLNYLFAAVLCVAALLALPWFKHLLPLHPIKQGLISGETPVAATEVLLQKQLPGPLFNDLAFGSYLIWAAQPEYPVFVDTRLELYPLAIWRDFLDISAAREGWQAGLDRYGIKSLMLSPTEQPALLSAARDSPDWQLIYEDDAAAIFVRVDAQE
jgi:hypothetical protein